MSAIPYPTDGELDADARSLLAQLPPLNVVRMFAGAPAALRPLTDLGQAILLHSELDPRLHRATSTRTTRNGSRLSGPRSARRWN